jgi:hypothetical protein
MKSRQLEISSTHEIPLDEMVTEVATPVAVETEATASDAEVVDRFDEVGAQTIGADTFNEIDPPTSPVSLW